VRNLVYRFRDRATWGIYVSLTAEAKLSDTPPTAGTHAYGPFWFELESVQLAGPSLASLVAGCELVGDSIQEKLDRRFVLISFEAIDFALTDFQDEGLTAAMALWLCEEFDVERPLITARYEREDNRYIYEFRRVVR